MARSVFYYHIKHLKTKDKYNKEKKKKSETFSMSIRGVMGIDV